MHPKLNGMREWFCDARVNVICYKNPLKICRPHFWSPADYLTKKKMPEYTIYDGIENENAYHFNDTRYTRHDCIRHSLNSQINRTHKLEKRNVSDSIDLP